MKPRALELLATLGLGLWTAAFLPFARAHAGPPVVSDAKPTAQGTASPPPAGDTFHPLPSPPSVGVKAARKADAFDDLLVAAGDEKPPRDIPMPLEVGSFTKQLKIPEVNTVGQILTLILAAKATRTDQQHVQMQEMKMDFYQPNGKEDFHIILPTSILNLQTHLITSDDPVTVRTADFELTGEKMEFNTLDRTGALTGHVRMTIHNLKQIASVPTPAHE